MSIIAKPCMTVGDLLELLDGVKPETPLWYDQDASLQDVVVRLHWTERPSNAHLVTIEAQTQEPAA